MPFLRKPGPNSDSEEVERRTPKRKCQSIQQQPELQQSELQLSLLQQPVQQKSVLQQTVLQKIERPKKEIKELCRLCLAMDVKMFSLNSEPLKQYYQFIEPCIDELEIVTNKIFPSTVCYMCANSLRKCYEFGKMCVQTQSVLMEFYLVHSKINAEIIKEYDRTKLQYIHNLNRYSLPDIHLDESKEIETPFTIEEEQVNKKPIKNDAVILNFSLKNPLSKNVEPAKIKIDAAKIKLAKAKIAVAKTNIDVAKTKIDVAKTKIDGARTKTDVAKTKIDVAKTKIDVAKTKINEEKTKIDAAKTKIDFAKTKVVATKTKIQPTLETTKTKNETSKVLDGPLIILPSSSFEDKEEPEEINFDINKEYQSDDFVSEDITNDQDVLKEDEIDLPVLTNVDTNLSDTIITDDNEDVTLEDPLKKDMLSHRKFDCMDSALFGSLSFDDVVEPDLITTGTQILHLPKVLEQSNSSTMIPKGILQSNMTEEQAVVNDSVFKMTTPKKCNNIGSSGSPSVNEAMNVDKSSTDADVPLVDDTNVTEDTAKDTPSLSQSQINILKKSVSKSHGEVEVMKMFYQNNDIHVIMVNAQGKQVQLKLSRTQSMKTTVDKLVKPIEPILKFERQFWTVRTLTKADQHALIQNRKLSQSYLKARLKCIICFKVFQNVANYIAHTAKHNPSSGQYCCRVCTLYFDKVTKLFLHERTHSRRYFCKMCPISVYSIKAAIEHQKAHVYYQCPVCNKEFRLISDFHIHKYEHAERVLKNSNVCIRSLMAFTKYQLDRYKIPTVPTIPEVKRWSATCCGIIFGHKLAYRKHYKRKHPDQNYPLAENGAICEICGLLIHTKTGLHRHLASHTYRKSLPFKCDHCPKVFRKLYNLERHQSVHGNAIKYTCSKCPKVFSTSFTWKRHLSKCKEGDYEARPYSCDVCGLKFQRNSYLKKHILSVHLGIKQRVSLVGEHFSPNTTGDGAGGLWYPYLCGNTPIELLRKWGTETYDFLHKLWTEGGSDISLMPLYVVQRSKREAETPDWAEDVYGYTEFNDKQLAHLSQYYSGNFVQGHTFVTYIAPPPSMLAYLLQRAQAIKITLYQARVTSLEDPVVKGTDVVVNCTGLGAGKLFVDDQVHPIRGQVLRVKAAWINETIIDEDGDNYIIPNVDKVVIGGTHQIGDFNTQPNAKDTKFIVDGCTKLVPGLKHSEIVSNWAGLRPGRDSVRLESSKDNGRFVIHNYGHGGSGFTLFWGCASQVVDLLQEELENNSKLLSKL